MRVLKLLTLILLISFSTSYNKGLQAIEKEDHESSPGIKITNSQEQIFRSEIYNQDIKLQIYLPMGYDESDTTLNKYTFLQGKLRESYPVLYLLDSDVYFGMASVIATLLQWDNKSPGIIIVGVRYGLSDWWDKRQFDYYPLPDTSLKIPGEASRYLEMYEKELIPFIESNFRADPNNRMLFGHSAGGIFTLYTLFSRPELFQYYISASPSVRYLSKFFFDIEKEYSKKRSDMPAKLYISMGALEQKERQPEWEKFIHTLINRNYNNLRIQKFIIEDEGHLSSAPISLVKGIQWCLLQK